MCHYWDFRLHWVETFHSSVSNSVYQSAAWFDNFFNEDGESAFTPKAVARIRVGWKPKSRDWSEFESKFRIKLRLPNFKNKVDLILSDEGDIEQSQLPLEKLSVDPDIEDDIKEKIQDSKGVGNFRSLFVNIPNGKEKGLQIIPVGNFESKDEFMNVKNVSAQDILNAHRFPPGLAGIIPANNAGLGDPTKYDAMYFKNETKPLIKLMSDEVARDPEIGSKLQLNFDLEPSA